tara:strand:+ start:120 stop:377 length:258 start_codon:yes stop_codon:yes gene_type:complete
MTDHNITYEVTETSEGVAQVTFTCGDTGIIHSRGVNVHDCEDDASVETRLSEVALGVASKIAVGTITAQEEEPVETETVEEQQEV